MTQHLSDLFGPGLGDTQRRLLLTLKRRGPSTLAELCDELDYAPATLREHLHALIGRDLVTRQGTRRGGPGRPEVVYALGRQGEALFPRREGEILRELVEYLREQGDDRVVRAFLRARITKRRGDAKDRVAGIEGRERLEEIARILSEDGYMASVTETEDGDLSLRLSHCPISELVAVTDLPCRVEEAFVEELLGAKIRRTEYMPAGCSACAYVQRGPKPA